MIVLSIGTDRKIFEEGSAVRARMVEYGKLFSELHIIIFTKAGNNFSSQKISDNVWVYPTNSKNKFKYFLDARKVFTKEMLSIKPDVITTQDPFETGIAGWLIRRKCPTAKLHMQIHTDFLSPYFKRSSYLNAVRVVIARMLLPKADRIRVVSQRIKASLVKIDLDLPDKTDVLPIYTDSQKFQNEQITIDLHKKYPKLSHIILMASRLTPEKNIAFALQVMRDVVIKQQNVGLIIVGDGPEKKYLEGLALQYHLDRNVVFESWQKELVSYYRTADMFLTTSLYEGYGLTLVEASAAGCPIIASDVGIARDIIEEGKTGFVCDVTDSSCFTKNILSLIEQTDLLQTMKSQVQHNAHAKINESKEQYLEKYKEGIERTVKNN